jgi:hypothetical protein
MTDPTEARPLIERIKALRPRRRVRRRLVQVLFSALTLVLAAQAAGAVLRLAGFRLPFAP